MVDLGTQVGSVALPNPVLTASGTAGHGAEFQSFFDLADLGAHVVKSLAAFAWDGNPAPRLHPAGAGMLNAVGLQGPGVTEWVRHHLPALRASKARVVASIWGRSVDDYRTAAAALSDVSADLTAVEVNLSCPNLEGRRGIFAHNADLSAEVVTVVAESGLPVWAKLSPNTDRLVQVAGAVQEAGAQAVTLVNTLLGMVIDLDSRCPVLGAGGGGYSGQPVHPVAVRAVYDVHATLPDLPILGVGGVVSGRDAVELMLAGAAAVQVGTANFADPRATMRVLRELREWCQRHAVSRVTDLVGAAH
jgi:dihydroorotate dehydrogenase (NAD+) catalytic subunit